MPNWPACPPTLPQPVALLSNTLTLPWATFLSVIFILASGMQNIAQLLATSRFIWALSRESAVPFSQFFKRISKRQGQPLQSIWVTVIIAIPALMLIGISYSIVATILLEGAAWAAASRIWTVGDLWLSTGRDALSGMGGRSGA
ncbi:amino acid permease-associated region [Pseudohyphozyma bogoriensis]|nr:amino acid permease-associated region [Pseudohyphozyma bogoriensis]